MALVMVTRWSCVGGRYPLGVAVSSEGDIAVSDWKSNRVQWLSQDGLPKPPIGGSGSELGRFDGPAGVAFYNDKSLLICDYGNQRVQVP
jgi:DNA-binding beta-propeller fold protein YncE